MSNLSIQQEYLMKILGTVGCMSTQQAINILMKYQEHINNPGYAKKIIIRLVKEGQCKFLDNDKYIVDYAKRSKLDRKSILLLDIALKFIDSPSMLEYIVYKAGELSFADNGKIYGVRYVDAMDVITVKQLDKAYLAEHKKPDPDFINIYIFDIGCDEESVLKDISKLGLKAPHMLFFNKTQDISDEISYDMFDCVSVV